MSSNWFGRNDPYEVSARILREKFAGARVAFVAGSFNRGEGTATSDIDLVVVYDSVPHAWRESFHRESWPVEVFVHDPETLNYFFSEVNRPSGVPSLEFMILEGRAIPEAEVEFAIQMKSLAEKAVRLGPPKWNDDKILRTRYAVTDQIDNLRAPLNPLEAKVTVAELNELVLDYHFRSRGNWSGSGRHLLRRLGKVNPDLFKVWSGALADAFQGHTDAFIALCLREIGGACFDGVKRDAPAEWRKPLRPAELGSGVIRELPLLDEERETRDDTLGVLRWRSAALGDVPALRRLLNVAYEPLQRLGLNFTATFSDDELVARDLLKHGGVLIVESPAGIVATMQIRDRNAIDDRRCLYIGRFAVDPLYQGSGIGTRLLRLAERIARREGYECLQLDTAQNAEHLVNYYEGQGFKIRKPAHFDAKTYMSWIFEKPIPKISI